MWNGIIFLDDNEEENADKDFDSSSNKVLQKFIHFLFIVNTELKKIVLEGWGLYNEEVKTKSSGASLIKWNNRYTPFITARSLQSGSPIKQANHGRRSISGKTNHSKEWDK